MKFWTPEREAKAKRLYLIEGKSAAETADIIGAASRSAIIGIANRKGWRKGLTKPGVSTNTRVRPPKAPPVKSDKCAGNGNNFRGHRPPKPGPQNRPGAVFGNVSVLSAAETEKKRAASASQGKTLLSGFGAPANDGAILLIDRRRFQCAWPVGLPDRPADQLCCGQPVAEGGSITTASYCAGHARIALSKQQPVRKVPTEPSPRRAA